MGIYSLEMNNHSCLKIDIRPEDYFEGDGRFEAKLKGLTTENWVNHFDFFVPQRITDGDTNDCWSFGDSKAVDAFMDSLIAEKILPQIVIDQITNMGFMDTGTDGNFHFHSSPRFAGVLSGAGTGGANAYTALDIFKKYGMVPFTKLPVTKDMTIAEYFAPIPQDLINLGAQFLRLMGGKDFVLYQWVVRGAATNIPKMVQAIKSSPLICGIPVDENGGWNQVHPVVATGNPAHVVDAMQIQGQTVEVSDNYVPYTKFLDPGYGINYVLQILVQYLPPPPAPQPQEPITIPTTVSWLGQLANWLQNILERLSPQGRAKLGGASRSPKWPEFKKQFAKTHLPVCAVCGGTKALNLHHLKPFHVYPELELDENNVTWLCNDKECHIRIGHLGNFQSINPNGKEDIATWHDKIRNRPETADEIKVAFRDK